MPRVLVIDDQAFVRRAISLILKARGYEVVEADSGSVGLRKSEELHFDLALIDIYMPGMDGVKTIKLLRERIPILPVIAMSGVPLNGTELTALDYFSMLPELSSITCIRKPFQPSELVDAIQKAIAHRRLATLGDAPMTSVLIVDDDEAAGIEAVKTRHFDLAIVDLFMAGMNPPARSPGASR